MWKRVAAAAIECMAIWLLCLMLDSTCIEWSSRLRTEPAVHQEQLSKATAATRSKTAFDTGFARYTCAADTFGVVESA
jgi:hypothetical protein